MNPCFGGDTAIIVVKLAQCAKRRNCVIILSGHASLFRSWCLHRRNRIVISELATTNTTTKLVLAPEQYQKIKRKLSRKQILRSNVVEKTNKAGAWTGTLSKIVKQSWCLHRRNSLNILLPLVVVAQASPIIIAITVW